MLPDWHDPDRNLWPPPKPSLAAAYAALMEPQHDPRYTADRAKAMEARAEAIRAEQQRVADYYKQLTREQEERVNAEERARFSGRRPFSGRHAQCAGGVSQ